MLLFALNLKISDILRVPQVDLDFRYPKYHNFSNQSIYADILEVSEN